MRVKQHQNPTIREIIEQAQFVFESTPLKNEEYNIRLRDHLGSAVLAVLETDELYHIATIIEEFEYLYNARSTPDE